MNRKIDCLIDLPFTYTYRTNKTHMLSHETKLKKDQVVIKLVEYKILRENGNSAYNMYNNETSSTILLDPKKEYY